MTTNGELKDLLSDCEHFTARELQAMNIDPPSFIVPGILPEGMSLLAAKPKVGKTMLAQNIAVAVASGTPALGEIPVQQGRVIFLALEGSTNGMQRRIDLMLEGEEAPDALHFVREFPALDKGGMNKLQEIVQCYPDTRLLIIDTFQHIRGTRRRQSAYEDDYEALLPLAKLCRDYDVSCLVIHHANKRQFGEFDVRYAPDLVSGTTGLTGAVDNVLVMQPGGASSTTLSITAREVESKEYRLSLDPDRALWIVDGEDWKQAKTPNRQRIVDAVSEADKPLGPKQIAERTGYDYDNLRVLLRKMLNAGELVQPEYGKYDVPPRPP